GDLKFHEQQEGSLCAQHCLNNLLQGEYFSPVELSSIAHQLDEEERMRMAEGGVTSEDYRTFLQQPSGNMDDSGFFSIQVISNALKVWGLELILFNSPEYQRLRIDPINERSFICNYKEHWFTVRKLGKQVIFLFLPCLFSHSALQLKLKCKGLMPLKERTDH
uniref:ubiquitinyl hydrolase 1 n=1 Tax=Propithecus coquereli TaxID=379532 RepID=A0A2K6EKY9_PROCO